MIKDVICGLEISLMGSLIIYTGTGLWELGLGALIFNIILIGGIYAKTNKDSQRRKA